MTIYLHDIPLPEAKAQLEAALKAAERWSILGVEEIRLDENALGRVLAKPVWAKVSSPNYHASAMDGFAVRAEETDGASPSKPNTLEYNRQAYYVDTGDPLPEWANAVIPIENVETLDPDGKPASGLRKPGAIRIRSSITPWSHVRPMGEDIVATQLVLPAGHILRPVDLGAVAACGHAAISVTRKPRVAVIPTGTELVEIGKPVTAGDIIEYNSIVLAAQVNAWGGMATRYPIVPDRYESICEVVNLAAKECDLILLNAGSSSGSEDFSRSVVESLGKLLVHGVAIRPGHPVILGMIGNIPIIGVPGYPVSAALTGEIFVEPLLAVWSGRRPQEPETLSAELTRKITSPAGDDDYLRVAVGRVGERWLAAPLAHGAGVITSLVQADGIVIMPRGVQGLSAGETVQVRLYRSMKTLENTIFSIGSHDISLDILAQFLALYDRRLASSNVGSLGGLISLRRGEAHLAGSHLLDTATGEFNLAYIREYLPGIPVKVIALVGRQQGLLVQRGNPKRIESLVDLARIDVSFVNRQRGAGTRILLDYQLGLKGIAPSAIRGYNLEEYTHLSLAAAIASGRADTGLGIAAAAQALNLDFIPLFLERYDLIVPGQNYASTLLEPLWTILEDPNFHQQVGSLPGYDISPMGKLIAELGGPFDKSARDR
jgi:putative molybdopterin biosynthesis protein